MTRTEKLILGCTAALIASTGAYAYWIVEAVRDVGEGVAYHGIQSRAEIEEHLKYIATQLERIESNTNGGK